MRRSLLMVLVMLVAACGTSLGDGPASPGSVSTLAPGSSTTLGETTSSLGSAPTTSPPPTTTLTTVAPSTTSTVPGGSPTTSPPDRTIEVVPYFYIDEAGHPNRTGPFIAPVARQVEPTDAVARAALEQLFAGPTKDKRRGVPTISTAIPKGVEILGLTISDHLAIVDLSSEFGATEDSPVVAERAAQVVFTLARFNGVFEVEFREEGDPVAIQIGDGDLVQGPVGIHDYLEFAAALSVESPVYGGPAGNPLRVAGFGAVFEATFHYALTDNDGLILEEGMAMTNNGVGWGGFDFTIEYEVDQPQLGALLVWTYSAENGDQIDIREYAVYLTP